MENFFSSIGFFMELLNNRTYAYDIVRCNRFDLLMNLKNIKVFLNSLFYGICMSIAIYLV